MSSLQQAQFAAAQGCSSRPWSDSVVFRFTAAVDFVRQPVQTEMGGRSQHLLVVVESEILVADFRQMAPRCVTYLMNLELYVRIQNKAALKCAKNYAN